MVPFIYRWRTTGGVSTGCVWITGPTDQMGISASLAHQPLVLRDCAIREIGAGARDYISAQSTRTSSLDFNVL